MNRKEGSGERLDSQKMTKNPLELHGRVETYGDGSSKKQK